MQQSIVKFIAFRTDIAQHVSGITMQFDGLLMMGMVMSETC